VYDLDEATYHGDTALAPEMGRSLSASGAKTLLKSPERFAYEREHGRPGTTTRDMGTLVHTLVLRSHDKRIVVNPHESQRTKAAQEWVAAREAEGRIVVTHKQVRHAITVAKAVRAHPLAGAILSKGRPEVSMYWTDADTGVTCRGRIDWLRDNALVDLKTCSRYGGAEPDTFGRQAANLDYVMSAAHYIDGWAALTGDVLPFYTITVELEEPHFITVSRYDDADLDAGRARMAKAKAEFAERESSGIWVDEPEVVTIPIPRWYQHTA
jgi:hypothetical protein